MADPTKFTPGYDYSDFQAAQPNKPKPGDRLDTDFANIATSIDQIVEAVKDVRRSDGALKNGIVTETSLAPGLMDGLVNGAIGAAQDSADAAAGSAVLSQAWAESVTSPDGTSSKSSKTWAGASAASATNAAASAAEALSRANQAITAQINASAYDPTLRFGLVSSLLASTRDPSGAGTVWNADKYFYREALPGATDHDLTTAKPVKLYLLGGDRWNPRARGAAADGTTNDKAVIDAVNVSGVTVDLDGADYAYTGDFVPVARFVRGRVISSTLGTFDYRVNEITQPTTVTVGTSGTIKTLKAAFDWLKSGIRITGGVTLTVTGDHDTIDYAFDHPDSIRVSIVASGSNPTVPTLAELTGDRATDEAFIKARFAAAINLGGTGAASSTGGLRLPFGINLISGIFFLSNTRYSLDLGFNESHANSVQCPGGQLQFCAFVGGVWGVIAAGCEIRVTANSQVLFAYQNTGTDPGGPIDMIGGQARIDGEMRCFNAGQAAKYVIHAEAGARVFVPILRAKGPYLHGIHAVDGASVVCSGMQLDGVTQAITAQPGSRVTCLGYTIANGDVANTNAIPNNSASQQGFGNNNAGGAVIFAGWGASISLNGGTMTNMIAARAFHAIGGAIAQGTQACAISDCRFTAAVATFYASPNNYLAVTVASPKSGSLDQALAQAGSRCMLGTNSGVSFSPSVGLVSNGNGFVSTATAGDPMGRRVAVPATATSAGQPGDFAIDGGNNWFYIYSGNGVTHTWRRVAVAAW